MKTIRVGPFGGQAGVRWDDGVHTGVRQMTIRSGHVVDAVQIEYDDRGSFKWFDIHGNMGGSTYTIKLDYPREHLKSISGYYNAYSDPFFISSMVIKTNKQEFGPFGTKKGEYFFIPSTMGKIVGFFGKWGPYLISLGAYLEPYYPYKSIGPFGGNDGVSWDDGAFTTIRKIIVVSESAINSILIDYDNDGSLVSSVRHGGNNRGYTNVVKLEYPDEYVTSVSGYYGANTSPIVIQSLVIRTNRRVFGPFGMEKGKYFTFPETDKGKIIGFHGKCGSHLYSLGGHLEITPNFNTVTTVGPFGISKEIGDPFDDGIHSGIKQIRINHGGFVNSISTKYYNNEDKMLVSSGKHGGDSGLKTDMVELDFVDEFLTSVSGYYDVFELNHYEITAIAFQSNKRTYGPFGRIVGKYFSFPSFDGKILGFHGICTRFNLYSIGAHVELISNPKPSEYIEPFGVQDGDQWDDGIYTTIRQIEVTCGSIVNSIRIEYDKNGHSVWSTKHGQSVGEKTYMIKLDYPYEFLISFSGSYSSTGIISLKIQSNKKRYGPFGFGKGKGNNEFSLTPTYGKLIGFHGKSSDYLHSIGAYLKPIPMSYQYETIEARGFKGRNLWDDGIYTTIRQLIIGSESVVDSIQIEYDKHGRSVWSARHGDSTGGSKYMVKLDFPSEYLVSISGYYSSDNKSPFIHSLTIQSNKRTYGPFGPMKGVPFSTPSFGGKIIGFHGTTSHYLCSIGVYKISPVSIGLFGGKGGDEWDDRVFRGTLKQIQLTVRQFGIESICFEYDQHGCSVWSSKYGSKAQGKVEKIIMEFPSEFLISVSGTYGAEYGFEIIQSIKFQSNKKTYGPFGLNKGNQFLLESAGDKIIGFHGRCGFFLDAIGAYIEPVSHL